MGVAQSKRARKIKARERDRGESSVPSPLSPVPTSIFPCFPYFVPLPTEINMMMRVQNQIRVRPWISSKLYLQNESGLQENFICNYFRASMSTLFSLMFEIFGSFIMKCSCFFKKLFTLHPKMIF